MGTDRLSRVACLAALVSRSSLAATYPADFHLEPEGISSPTQDQPHLHCILTGLCYLAFSNIELSAASSFSEIYVASHPRRSVDPTRPSLLFIMTQISDGKSTGGVLQIPAAATQKNASTASKKAPKPAAPRLKLLVRRLPPGLTQSEFENALGSEWMAGAGRVDWYQYKPGKVSKESVLAFMDQISIPLLTNIGAAMPKLPDPPARTYTLHPASILRLYQIKSDRHRS